MPRTYTDSKINITELFRGLVSTVSANLSTDPDINTIVSYQPGTIQHVNNKVTQYVKTKKKRFPLIALLHTFDSDFGDSAAYTESELTFWIMTLAPSQNASYELRSVESFEKVLYPILLEFKQVIRDSYLFEIDDTGLEGTETDRYNWGFLDNNGNVRSIVREWVDGVELKLRLKLNYQACLTKQINNNEIKIIK